jgi:hypothetical protein
MASLAMARLGTPQCFLDMMFNTIDTMNHHIRATHGDSTSLYNSGNSKFHVILQGNGAGPTIWTMFSSPLLNSLRYEVCGAKIIDPITKHTLLVPEFAFSDDTDLVQTIEPGPRDNTKSTQQALQLWEEGLRT